MLLVHYGSWRFSLAKFEPIKNTSWVKPDGGLWTSPLNSKYGWKEFCQSERFRVNHLKSRMILKLKSTKILTIDCVEDLNKIEWMKINDLPFYKESPNFEKLQEKYDAIHLTLNGQNETRHSYPNNLYGWDVETVLILNPKIEQIYPRKYAS